MPKTKRPQLTLQQVIETAYYRAAGDIGSTETIELEHLHTPPYDSGDPLITFILREIDLQGEREWSGREIPEGSRKHWEFASDRLQQVLREVDAVHTALAREYHKRFR